MTTVEFNKKNENPFYGLSNCLKLQQSVSSTITTQMLDRAWAEVSDNKQKRELFFSILFSIGDITNRQHNIFKGKKKDNGGNANRTGFEVCFKWLWNNQREQFIKFMNAQLFNEYSCFDLLYKNRVKTVKGSSKVSEVYSYLLDPEYNEALLNYTYSVINGNNPFNKMLVAKFLTIPRTSKRQGHKRMLDVTKDNMKLKANFIYKLSDMMGWEKQYFKGYRDWRKQYNGELESVLFSTGKINEFTKDEFISWFDKLPAQARFRVKNRILYSKRVIGGVESTTPDKWLKFQSWLKIWEALKEEKQQEQRILEEKVRQGQASEEDKIKLQKVKKEAKVTTGATNFKELYNDICRDHIDKLKLESFINKIHLDYNTLVIIDDSGSMTGAPFNFATFLASVCLVKNPDDDARNLIGFFATNSHWHSFMDSTIGKTPNSLMRQRVAQTNAKPLVDPTLSFFENYQRINRFCHSVFRSGGTYLHTIIRDLKPLVNENLKLLDTLKSYPIWTIVSDGDINSSWDAKESIQEFFNDCQAAFGFKPYLVLIDVANQNYLHPEKFEGLENFMYIPGNVNLIEQFLTNFKDIDVMDVYQSLQALYRSNRYELVRANTL